jgi:hypothetical protein
MPLVVAAGVSTRLAVTFFWQDSIALWKIQVATTDSGHNCETREDGLLELGTVRCGSCYPKGLVETLINECRISSWIAEKS